MLTKISISLLLLFCSVFYSYAQEVPANAGETFVIKVHVQQPGVNNPVNSLPETDSASYITIRVKLSDDGKAIINEEGKEIARFSEATKKGDIEKMNIPGCLCCVWECIAYDSNEHCIKIYRNCTWDFECSCAKK